MQLLKKIIFFAAVSFFVAPCSSDVDLEVFAEAERLVYASFEDKAKLVEGLSVSVPGGVVYLARPENFREVEDDINNLLKVFFNSLGRIKPELAPLLDDFCLMHKTISLDPVARFAVANCALWALTVRRVLKEDVEGLPEAIVFGSVSMNGQDYALVSNVNLFRTMFQKVFLQSLSSFMEDRERSLDDSWQRIQALFAKHAPASVESLRAIYSASKVFNRSFSQRGVPSELVELQALFDTPLFDFMKSLGLDDAEGLSEAFMSDVELIEYAQSLFLKYQENPCGSFLTIASRLFDTTPWAAVAVAFVKESLEPAALYDVASNILYTDLPVVVGHAAVQDDCLLGTLQKDADGYVVGLALEQCVELRPMRDSILFRDSIASYARENAGIVQVVGDSLPQIIGAGEFAGDLALAVASSVVVSVPEHADRFVASWKSVLGSILEKKASTD